MTKISNTDVESGSDDLLSDSYCTEIDHLFSLASRDLIGRYLANFLFSLVLTPTELVFSAKYQKRLSDAGRTMMNVIDKLGTMQARVKKEPGSKRVKELSSLVTAGMKKVWDDEKERPVGSFTPDTFLTVAGRLKETGAERDYILNRMLAEHLGQYKVWKDKISVVVQLVKLTRDTDEFRLIEPILGECLKSEPALDQLLGLPERLETRCDDLIDLWKGAWEPRPTASDLVTDIAALIAENAVPNCKAAIEHALLRTLSGKLPLRSEEPEQEIQAVFDMFRRMWVGTNLIGGPKALAMLERRQARHINNETVTDLLRERKVLADRVAFLMVLTAIAVGQINRNTLKTFTDHYFNDQDFVPRITMGQDAPVPKLQTLCQIHRALRGSWLTDDEKTAFCAKVEAAQIDLLKRSRLFEQIDKKGGGPSQKLLTVLDLARKGTFIEGAILDSVKRVMTSHLQHPQFTMEYLGNSNPEERDRKVDLLSKTLAGFGLRWNP